MFLYTRRISAESNQLKLVQHYRMWNTERAVKGVYFQCFTKPTADSALFSVPLYEPGGASYLVPDLCIWAASPPPESSSAAGGLDLVHSIRQHVCTNKPKWFTVRDITKKPEITAAQLFLPLRAATPQAGDGYLCRFLLTHCGCFITWQMNNSKFISVKLDSWRPDGVFTAGGHMMHLLIINW